MNIQKIEELMYEKGIKAAQIAKETGVPNSTISRIVNGEIPDPRVSLAAGIAKVLEVQIEEII